MSLNLRANTAVDVLIGPFVDITDGNTTEDGLSASLTSAATKLSKNGQPLASRSDVTDCAFDDDGYYNCELNVTDTNTEGSLVLIVHISATALPVRHEFNVLSEAAWDSLHAAKDAGFMDVNIKTIGRADTQETEADNLETACANFSVTRGLTGTAVPAVAADGVGGLPISDAGGLDLDTQLATTDQIGAAGAGLTAINLPNQTMDIIGSITGNLSGTVGSVTGAVGSVTGGATEAKQDTAQTDLDTITGTGGVLIGTDVMDRSGTLDINTKTITTDAITAAALNADAVDEIWAKAMSDLAQGAPSATASVLTAVNYLYEALRNHSTTTATRYTLFKDDTTTELMRSTISDDATTFDKGEMATGV